MRGVRAPRSRRARDWGFTLVETLVSLALVGLIVIGSANLYRIGTQFVDAGSEELLLDSELQSRMETLISEPFDAVVDGADTVSVAGESIVITWKLGTIDLDGDTLPEPTAKTVTVSVPARPWKSLVTLLVDNEDRIGKI